MKSRFPPVTVVVSRRDSLDALSQFFGQRMIGYVDLDVHLLDARDRRDLLQCGTGLANAGTGLEADTRRRWWSVEVEPIRDRLDLSNSPPCYGRPHGPGHFSTECSRGFVGWQALGRIVRLWRRLGRHLLQAPGDQALQPVASDLAGRTIRPRRRGQRIG